MLLSFSEINELIAKYPKWRLNENRLILQREFADFKAAMQFVNEIARIAEALQHHPYIIINYASVYIELYSHDVGGITERDKKFVETLA